jgi:hypothetical protein
LCFVSKNIKVRVCRTVSLSVILYGCEIWSLSLDDGAFRNGVLRRMFEPKRHEIIGRWRKLDNEKLHNLYSSPNIIRVINSRMLWAVHVTDRERTKMQLLLKDLKERDHTRDLGIYSRIILK